MGEPTCSHLHMFTFWVNMRFKLQLWTCNNACSRFFKLATTHVHENENMHCSVFLKTWTCNVACWLQMMSWWLKLFCWLVHFSCNLITCWCSHLWTPENKVNPRIHLRKWIKWSSDSEVHHVQTTGADYLPAVDPVVPENEKRILRFSCSSSTSCPRLHLMGPQRL